jgi:hypothetical protein
MKSAMEAFRACQCPCGVSESDRRKSLMTIYIRFEPSEVHIEFVESSNKNAVIAER